MSCSDLLIVERGEWNHDTIRRYALCPGHAVTPGDLVKLHGDPNIYEVTHTFCDLLGELQKVSAAMNPVFYVQKHWCHGKEFSLNKGEEVEVLHEPV